MTDDANEETKQGRDGIPADLVAGLTDFTGPFQYGIKTMCCCEIICKCQADKNVPCIATLTIAGHIGHFRFCITRLFFQAVGICSSVNSICK